ncbi:MAG TPA: COP23 domain-containing protein [Nostocaceae cyanobacterium]|nr:COP23 domain-containing protein [Nostocaceae cyanobacterium]
MISKSLRFVCLSGVSLSLILGQAGAYAQTGGVVVPTDSSGSTTTPTTTTTIDSNTRFSCQFYNGRHTVMYQPESQPRQFFAWAAPQELGGGWTPQKRCEAIASRLELFRPDGLQELRTGRENSENTICATTDAVPSCRLVLTVPRDKDPNTILSSVFQNLVDADEGKSTVAVNTYRNNRQGGVRDIYNVGRTILGGNRNQTTASQGGINLKPFLDVKDGGTGANLKNGVSFGTPTQAKPSQPTQPQRTFRLNPRIFRK